MPEVEEKGRSLLKERIICVKVHEITSCHAGVGKCKCWENKPQCEQELLQAPGSELPESRVPSSFCMTCGTVTRWVYDLLLKELFKAQTPTGGAALSIINDTLDHIRLSHTLHRRLVPCVCPLLPSRLLTHT